ncbi:MAG: 6-bladed beta-propeller [Candidatus Aminicenantaceae bacterium]
MVEILKGKEKNRNIFSINYYKREGRRQSRQSKFLILVLLLVVSISCIALQGKELKSIHLEEVLSVGSLDDDVLFMWAGITTDPEGNIYVTDMMDYSIKKFSDRGILVKKAGRKGQGPGEFLAPRIVKHFKGRLYVTDQSVPGIQVFDVDLNFKTHIPLSIPILDLKIISPEKIYISTSFFSEQKSIRIVNSQGKIVSDLWYLDGSRDYWKNLKKFEIDVQHNLYVVSSFEDKIQKFDKHGKKLWTKHLLGKKKVKRKRMDKTKFGPSELPVEVVYKDIALDTSGNLFILGGHLSKNRSRDVYILDAEGNHLNTVTLSESSHCIHIDDQNFLYSRAGMGTTIKKYFLKKAHQP